MYKNRFRLLKSYLTNKELRNAFPLVLGIETTNRCNLDCIMCPRQHMQRKIGDISMDFFKKLIDEIKERVEYVWLQNYGEPLLHKNFFDLIKYAKSVKLCVGISTNATLLDKEVIEKLLSSELDYIIFAFDGANKITYENIRRGATYNHVLENVKQFIIEKERKRAKIFTVLQCIYMDETKREIYDFYKMWNIKGVDALRVRQLTYSGSDKHRNVLKKPCYWLWHTATVTWNGILLPCCQDVNAKYPVGDLVLNSLESLWNSAKLNNLRKLHIAGKFNEIPLCRNCNMYQPSNFLVCASGLLPVPLVNKIVPRVESFLVKKRYSLA